ncbi:hypothetical protein [Clostridium sp. DJ247]|uniref:hypothetical protein n=1 Tax=Clostridium sp. DJ247 TaxID=2726188 RepID=UPI001A9B7651|nr:hypothetical protein [Clostridium sp. DJ247]
MNVFIIPKLSEIIEAINGQQELLIEFDDKIFNALVEKIEILEPTHFVFVLRNGIRMEEILE